MARILMALLAAAVTFVLLGIPTGVVEMVNPHYCFTHEERPATTSFHEERLRFFPPGPECEFTLEDGTIVVARPGWWPAMVTFLSIAVALIVLWRRPSIASLSE